MEDEWVAAYILVFGDATIDYIYSCDFILHFNKSSGTFSHTYFHKHTLQHHALSFAVHTLFFSHSCRHNLFSTLSTRTRYCVLVCTKLDRYQSRMFPPFTSHYNIILFYIHIYPSLYTTSLLHVLTPALPFLLTFRSYTPNPSSCRLYILSCSSLALFPPFKQREFSRFTLIPTHSVYSRYSTTSTIKHPSVCLPLLPLSLPSNYTNHTREGAERL